MTSTTNVSNKINPVVQKQKTVDDDFFGLNFNRQNMDLFAKLEAPIKQTTPAASLTTNTNASNDLFDFDSVFRSPPMSTSVTMPDLFNVRIYFFKLLLNYF